MNNTLELGCRILATSPSHPTLYDDQKKGQYSIRGFITLVLILQEFITKSTRPHATTDRRNWNVGRGNLFGWQKFRIFCFPNFQTTK